MRIRRGAEAMTCVAAAALLLTGCVATPVRHTHVTPTSGSSRPSPSVFTAPAPSPTPTGDAIVVPGMVGQWPVEIPVDSGPRQYAMGTAMKDTSGVPVAYRVARGDVIDYVAERFGFFDPAQQLDAFEYLNTINQVRRGTYSGAPDENFQLYAGDVLNLSPYTISSVGDENGRTITGPLPSPAPPQR